MKKFDWRAIKFLLFSISAGIIQIASFALLDSFTSWAYWIKYIISLVLSVLWNFTFNRRYTFRSNANIPRAMFLTFLFYVAFTPLSTWGGDWLVHIGWNDILVLLLSMISNFILEYLFQLCIVYRNQIDTNDLAHKKK